MKPVHLLLPLLLAACVSDEPAPLDVAPGELVYRQGTVTWRLLADPCGDELLREALAGDDFGAEAKAAVVQAGSRSWRACWAEGISEVAVADYLGVGMLPREWFMGHSGT